MITATIPNPNVLTPCGQRPASHRSAACRECAWQTAYTARVRDAAEARRQRLGELAFLWNVCLAEGFSVGSCVYPHTFGVILSIEDRDTIYVRWESGRVESVRWTEIAAR